MASTASLNKNRKSTLARINRFLSKDDHFSTGANQIIMKCHNSLHSRIYSNRISVSCKVKSIKSKEETQTLIGSASSHKSEDWVVAKVGDEFGPTWSTHLFKVEINIPTEWQNKEVHFRWNSSSEAMLINSCGNVIQGFVPKHRESYTISKRWTKNESNDALVYYVEMACNGLFGALGEGFSIDPPNPALKYKLKMVEIAVFEPLLFKLYTDLEMLAGIAEELPDDIRGFQALYSANEMINIIINHELQKASDTALKFFSERNGEKAHTLVAMGHCHIDTAWLWTYNETKRKCARSWSSQIQLMKEYPDIIFTCSQAQQLAWMKEEYPGLFEEIKKYVALKRFIPVGGTWVEMDGLLPDGESMIRQFFYGQKFFEQEFNLRAKEFWLPDTFGYSGQFPQIMKHMGISRFLTQKISWNRVNKFPHHSFIWEGIDGSEVIAHFPPGDSYEMNGWVKELLKSVNNCEDKGRTSVGAYLYGLGDGGGGPTVPIIERLRRMQNVDGLPKIEFNTPDYFFNKLESDSHKLCKWVGELYLEMHNGTYTSQAKIKELNRKVEILLKATELQLAIRILQNDMTIAKDDLAKMEKCWKDLLLNQFHDVIPGSCIELVAQDALRIYENILINLENIRVKYNPNYIRQIMASDMKEIEELKSSIVCFNPLPWSVRTVCSLKIGQNDATLPKETQCFQIDNKLPFMADENASYVSAIMELSPSGYGLSAPIPIQGSSKLVKFSKSPDGSSGSFCNGLIRLEFSLNGPPKEKLYFRMQQGQNAGQEWTVFEDFKRTGTEPGMFYIYDDNPVCWDAWDCDDFHLETRQSLLKYVKESDLHTSIEIISEGPLVACYKWSIKAEIGHKAPLNITRYTIVKAESPLVQYTTKVDWRHQSHKFLKVEFPINVLAREATYEIQHGHIKRPTHSNTSWDIAQIETSGHKWVDISQSDRGVSLINDSKYGFRIKDNVVRLSLLRSPKAPDGNCDMHEHIINYAMLPHDNSLQDAGTIRQAYEFNYKSHGAFSFGITPKEAVSSVVALGNVITVSHEAIIPEVFKPGYEDTDKTICIRMYESFGGNASDVTIKIRGTLKEVIECDGMETPFNQPLRLDKVDEKGVIFSSFRTEFRPFQIKSYLLYLN